MLSHEQKVYLSMLIGGIWIYYREQDRHYRLLPRRDWRSVVGVMLWIYLNYREPLVLPLGLAGLYWYGERQKVASRSS